MLAPFLLTMRSVAGDRFAVKITGGATIGSATNLSIIDAAGYAGFNRFILGDGFYSGATITRPGIMLQAENTWAAKTGPLTISANNVSLHGLSITTTVGPITINNPGAQINNCELRGFGHTAYANGISVSKSALNPTNRTIIAGNTITDWGIKSAPLDPFAAGIAVGVASDTQDITAICVEISGNQITDGPVLSGLQSAGIQLFFPALVRNNLVHTVSGSGVQMKSINSIVQSNEFVNILFDGAFNQRFPIASNNLWENNFVHNCDVGIDHYMGSGVIYRGNVIHTMGVYGRIKDFDTTNGMLIKNNTFYNSTGTAGFIWELTGGVTFTGIVFQDNIWDTTNGLAIQNLATSAWVETGNIFWNSTPPSPIGTGSQVVNPLLTSPPTNFTPLAPAAAGKGALWPLPT
jgi:hypothetical protein